MLLLAVSAWFAVLSYQRDTGQIVYVRVEPIDPWDFLRGDFVVLRYAIQSELAGQPDQPAYLTDQPIEPGSYADSVVVSDVPTSLVIRRDSDGQAVLPGRYYTQKNTGYIIERQVRDRQVVAEIALTDSGRALLRDLLVDGQSIREIVQQQLAEQE